MMSTREELAEKLFANRESQRQLAQEEMELCKQIHEIDEQSPEPVHIGPSREELIQMLLRR